MKYSWRFKLDCVEKYKSGIYIPVPEHSKVSHHDFMHMVRDWQKLFDLYGTDGLKKNGNNRILSTDDRFECVARVMAGESMRKVAFDSQIGVGSIYQWVRKYKLYGYDGLKLKKGRKPKEPNMKKEDKPKNLTKSEKEELIILRRQNEYLKAENAYLKKLRALIVQKRAESSVKAKKQLLSEDSETKDID